MRAVLFFRKQWKIMLLMMNYAKNYASSLEKNYQINKQIN